MPVVARAEDYFAAGTDDGGGYLVNCSNPLLSAQEAAIVCKPAQIAADRLRPGSVSADVFVGRRSVEGIGRLASYDHRSYRVVGGIDGEISDDWHYNAYALYYYNSLLQVYTNYLSTAAINNALQVTTDQSGRPVCIGGGCVPYDIFSSGAVKPQQLAYLYTVGTDSGANSEQILEVDVTGQPARYGLVAPWAHEGVARLRAGLLTNDQSGPTAFFIQTSASCGSNDFTPACAGLDRIEAAPGILQICRQVDFYILRIARYGSGDISVMIWR